MIKYFCDQCGREYNPHEVKAGANPPGSMGRDKGKIKVQLIVAVGGVWTGGEACKDCILDAVATGKDS